MGVPRACSNPLEFGLPYPATALRVLCLSTSSAQSERDFSSVGRTVTNMPSRLNEDTVEAIELLRRGKRTGLISW